MSEQKDAVRPCPFCGAVSRAGPDAAWYFDHASDCWLRLQNGQLLNCVSVSERKAWNTRLPLALEMLKAIQGALRIADLWRPNADSPKEYLDEAEALHLMFIKFEDLARRAAIDLVSVAEDNEDEGRQWWQANTKHMNR